ncbi:MAG: putative 1-acylglycerol-3-phosphate O-acyltransferase [Bacillales bacterium]|nr:putative 1-acylglycerol-3-phosphate O-acyltransferase [Bacillales bacterium]
MERLIRAIKVIFFAVTYVLFSYIKVKRYEKTAVNGYNKDLEENVHKFAKKFGTEIIRKTGSSVSVSGLENIPQDQAVLFVGNHQSNFDIPLLVGYLERPVGFVAKIEINKIPILSRWMKLLHCVLMDRSNRRQSLQAIKDGIDNLKNGYSMVIFPEGTRSKGKGMVPFKQGSLKLGTAAEVPIVPFVITGTHDLMETADSLFGKGNVTLKVLEPINFSEYRDIDNQELVAIIQSRINKELPVVYKMLSE